MLRTSKLCGRLKVNRAWISKYMRHLGLQWPDLPMQIERKDLRTVFYDESEVLAYLNEHATFSRQTEEINIGEFVPPNEIRALKDFLEEMKKQEKRDPFGRDYDRQVLIMEFLQSIGRELPGVSPVLHAGAAVRRRGKFAWHNVDDVSIESLSDMISLSRDGSTELDYRKFFLAGYIRVCVHGHVWFMEPKKEDKYEENLWVLCRPKKR